MSTQLLRWGIVSAGKISEDFVIALSTLPPEEHAVTAVAARDLTRAQVFAKKHDIPSAFGSYEELSKCPDVDVVYVGCLNPQHCEVTLLMLNNGKHVLCEKPMAMNRKQVESMVDAAKKNNRFLMEGIWSRFFPSYQYVREQVNSGALGEIYDVDIAFGFDLMSVERLNDRELGGGVMYDLGIYALQLAQWVYQEKAIIIDADAVLNEDKVDIEANFILTYSGDRTAHVKLSAKEKLHNSAMIVGTDGDMRLVDFWAPTRLVDVDKNQKNWPLPDAKFVTNYQNSVAFRFEAMEVRKSILAGEIENPTVTHTESLLFAKMEDCIRQAVGAINKYDDFNY